MGKTGWGVNNWNPWILSNLLVCVLTIERSDRLRALCVRKALVTLDAFTDVYPADGGCDEGASYWARAGASLFECIEIISLATEGALDWSSEPLIAEIARYIVRMHISDDRYVNFADGAARVTPSAELLYRYGRYVGDNDICAHAAYITSLPVHRSAWVERDLTRIMSAFFLTPDMSAALNSPPMPVYSFLPGIEVMTAREHAGRDEGFFLAIKGGHNEESHNHNDVGTVIVYKDGLPVLCDIGIGTYTKDTFTSRRYEVISEVQSRYHNLPVFGGVQQSPGRNFCARNVSSSDDEGTAQFALDIAGAYPEEAGVKSCMRRAALDRGNGSLRITDRWELDGAREVTEYFITPCEPEFKTQSPSGGMMTLGSALFEWHASAPVSASAEIHKLDDPHLTEVWGDRLWRVALTVQSGAEGEVGITLK